MSKTEEYASLFSWTRFGPGSLAIFGLLGIMAVLLFKFGFRYIVILPIMAAVVIFVVKLVEVIKIENIERVQIVGKKCYVVKHISKSEAGVVRLYTDWGKLGYETWSARTEQSSTIKEGTNAIVTAMRGIHLIVEQE
ncbi:MAG: NfeD family protein [Nitrososphaerota archaeon]|nr:NfeD family protein [Nitrososphaerota archaeon]